VSVPGTEMFTYWPGRKPTGFASRTDRLKEVSDSASMAVTSPCTVCGPVLQISDEAGMLRTQSLSTVIWHGRT